MSKGYKQRGNKEAKKPKKEIEEIVVTSDFAKGKLPLGCEKKK